MALPDIFSKPVTEQLIHRIGQLKPETKPKWGKMSVGQMLAHCNVSYEMVYENIHAKPGPLMRFILKLLVKGKVVGQEPYKHNNPTAPQFKMTTEKEFAKEKNRLIDYINKTQQLGGSYFEGKESNSFGKLTITEWNNMLYKHLDHHLTQFGV